MTRLHLPPLHLLPPRIPILLLALFCCLSLSSLPSASAAYLRVWSSIQLWTSRLEQQPSIPLKPVQQFAHPKNTLTVDLSTRYQRLVGFGGAITEAATITLAKLTPAQQDEVIAAYYSEQGHGYTLGRVPINSCDFSVSSYSFDDVVDDFRLEHFDRQVKHDNETIIPFIRKALKAATYPSSASSSVSRSSNLKLIASPWSPPAWMKGNGQMTGSSSPCLKSDKRYHSAWADYYVHWLSAYASYGIPFFGVTVQNEPEFAAPWEACTYTPQEQRDFIVDFLAPALRKYNRDLKILAYDHNKDHVAQWAATMYGDTRIKDAIWGMAVHWYSGDAFDMLEKAHQLSPQHQLLASEACNCPGTLINDWTRAEKYAHDIIGDLNHWAVGWMDWNIALDERGGPNHLGNLCDAQMLVRTDFSPPSVHFQPLYYVFGHFSRFLRPGSVRIQHQLTSTEKRQPVHRIGPISKDAGAAQVSEVQSANIASENNNIEVTTWLDEERGKVIIVLFNPTGHQEDVLVVVGKDGQGGLVNVPAHSLHTVTGNVELF